MYYLYKIINIINNKIYIGQSIKEKDRWRQHRYFGKNPEKTGQYIHRAMNKYGDSNFTYEVVAMCLTQQDTDETEKVLIEQYKSRDKNFGYNIAPGGNPAWNRGLPKEQQPMYGKHHSEESKQKSSKSNTGKVKPPHSQEWKDNISLISKGKPKSKEWIEKRMGENHPRAKLTWVIVDSIREEYENSNITQTQLAEKHGITQDLVSLVVNKKCWNR